LKIGPQVFRQSHIIHKLPLLAARPMVNFPAIRITLTPVNPYIHNIALSILKWAPASAGQKTAGMVHSVSG